MKLNFTKFTQNRFHNDNFLSRLTKKKREEIQKNISRSKLS
jgi:hypothetical protein